MTAAARLKPAAGYIGLGIVLYLAFLIATVPAGWLAVGAAHATGGALTLTRTSGTLWHGAGELHAGAPASGAHDLGRFQWHLSPWRLVLGRARLSLRLDGSAARGRTTVDVGWHRVTLDGLEATFPAGLVPLVYSPAAFFQPTGTIELHAPKVALTAKGLVANVRAQWRGAGGRFTGADSLGDYRIDIAATGPTASIRLSTLRGRLDLSGQGAWRVAGDGSIRFTGVAAPKGNAAELEPLLRVLGRDLGGGRRQIRFNARFPLVRQLDL